MNPYLSSVKPAVLDFFAWSGLVTQGLSPYFQIVWANDISPKKAAVYIANHGIGHFHTWSVSDVNGKDLPKATVSWASFPCQDLSLAGMAWGIYAARSWLVWEWLRVMDEMEVMPPILVAENVTGLVSSAGGENYKILHSALRSRGYRVGAVLLDAEKWVPQSRQRIFVIACRDGVQLPPAFVDDGPNWMHSRAIISAASGLDWWVWWKMKKPSERECKLTDIVDWNAEEDEDAVMAKLKCLISDSHKARLYKEVEIVAPAYRRTRNGKQALELRFDGIAGCLRTPKGWSSRQYLVIKRENRLSTRLLTVRETARLMWAPDSYELPWTYNDGYFAMGDAVAVPVVDHLAKNLLMPLSKYFEWMK